ncbi:MAG: WD40/YVTN/BNR-like repeat-containing protein, partial [Candidatus Binatia bacterium]
MSAGIAVAQTRASQGWVWQNPLPQGNPLYSINFAKDKETGFAVGADNTILHTDDGGFHWDRQFSMLDVTLSSVFARDEKNAVAVGSRGTILVTDDGGKYWRQIKTDVKDHLSSVVFTGADDATGWAVGTYG